MDEIFEIILIIPIFILGVILFRFLIRWLEEHTIIIRARVFILGVIIIIIALAGIPFTLGLSGYMIGKIGIRFIKSAIYDEI